MEALTIRTWKVIPAVIAGVLLALLVFTILDQTAPQSFAPYERENPFEYSHQSELFKRTQFLHDLLGIVFGIFSGVLLFSLLCSNARMYMANLMTLTFLLTISFPFFFTWINKELIWLALPVWIFVSLLSFYAGRYINKRRGMLNFSRVKE